MKLCIDTCHFRNLAGDIEALRMIKKAGFDGYDYTLYDTDETTYMLGDDYLTRAKEIRKTADEVGLYCEQSHAPLKYRIIENFDLDNLFFREIVRSFEFSAVLGAKTCVVHSLSYNDDLEECLVKNTAFYKALEPYARKAGIRIGIENLIHHRSDGPGYTGRLNRPEQLRELLRRLNSDCFTICVDVGHAAITGVEPQDLIRGLNNQELSCLHVQDTDYIYDCHTLPFFGKQNWLEIIRALKDIDYQGALTYEIAAFFSKTDPFIVEQQMVFAHDVGRKLIGEFDKNE